MASDTFIKSVSLENKTTKAILLHIWPDNGNRCDTNLGMILPLMILCTVGGFLLLEFWVKSKVWKCGAQLLLLCVVVVLVFHGAASVGDSAARGDIVLQINSCLDTLLRSVSTNSIEEVQAKLEILRQDMPGVIYKTIEEESLLDKLSKRPL